MDRLFRLEELRYDRWRLKKFQNRLDRAGLRINAVPFGQGYKEMGPAVEDFERLLLDGELQHDNDPVTNRCIANCGTEQDPKSTSDARKPVKMFPTGRIDAAVAALMAVADHGTEEPTRTVDDYVQLVDFEEWD